MARGLAVALAAVCVIAAPMSLARSQDAPAPAPIKPATPAQIRALKALYPKPTAAVGAEQIAPADAAYYDCVAKRLYMPLSRVIDRPMPPTKERVSALIASRAQESSCGVGGDDRDFVAIKPALILEATALFAARRAAEP